MDPAGVDLGLTLKDVAVHAVDDRGLILKDDTVPVVEGLDLILRDAKNQVVDGLALILSDATNHKEIERRTAESSLQSTSTKEEFCRTISRV